MNFLGLWNRREEATVTSVSSQSLQKSRSIRMGVWFPWIIWNARVDVGGVGGRRREAHVVKMFVLFAKHRHFSGVAHWSRLSGGRLLHHGSLHLRSPGYSLQSILTNPFPLVQINPKSAARLRQSAIESVRFPPTWHCFRWGSIRWAHPFGSIASIAFSLHCSAPSISWSASFCSRWYHRRIHPGGSYQLVWIQSILHLLSLNPVDWFIETESRVDLIAITRRYLSLGRWK